MGFILTFIYFTSFRDPYYGQCWWDSNLRISCMQVAHSTTVLPVKTERYTV